MSGLNLALDSDILNEILMQVVKKAGFTWDESFEFNDPSVTIDFPIFVQVLTECFDALHIDISVVAEIVSDIKGEIVDGVLRKGYMYKRGHNVHNWKRRFFILTRNSLTYYTSREKMEVKVSSPLTLRNVSIS